MDLRLFFPLWSMKTIIGEVSSAYRQEINKLRNWGISTLLPHLVSKKYKSYPFKITIRFFVFFDIETTSLMLMASYIINELGLYTFQSADYRVVPQVEIVATKASSKEAEGCQIVVERYLQPQKQTFTTK